MEELLLNFSRTCSQAREKIIAVSEIIGNGIVPDDCTLREMEEMITAVRESHDAVKNWFTSETGRDLSSDVPVADIKMLYDQYLDECLKKRIQELSTTVELFLSVKSDKEDYTDALRPNREKARAKLELLKQEDDTVDVSLEDFFLSLLDADRTQLFEQSVMDKLDENFSDIVQAGLFKGKYYIGDEPVQDPEPVKDDSEVEAVPEEPKAEPEYVPAEEASVEEPVAEEFAQESEQEVPQEECKYEEDTSTEREETVTEEPKAEPEYVPAEEAPVEEPVAEEFAQESEQEVSQEECKCEECIPAECEEAVAEEVAEEPVEEAVIEEPDAELVETSTEEVQEEQELAEEPASEELAEDEEIIEFDEPESETGLDDAAPAMEGEQTPFQESDIVKSGHWYSETVPDESLSFEEEEGTEVTENTSGDPLTHKVIFNAEPGTIDGSSQIEMTVADGALINQPESFIYCDGLDFVYWYNEDESEPFSFPAYISKDTVFHSKWV